jgi:hypothetical protein
MKTVSIDRTEKTDWARRHRRACERAKTLLENPPAGYRVVLVKDPVFDVVAWNQNEVLALRVAVDRISSEDIRLVREEKLPNGTVKKILKKEHGKESFEEKLIN